MLETIESMPRIVKIAISMMLWIVISLGCTARDKESTRVNLEGPGNYHISTRFGNLDRRYTVHVPSGHRGKNSMPIVIMLHGGGGSSRSAIRTTGWIEKADEEGFLAVFPNAMPPDPTKPSRFAGNPQLWNDGSDRFYPGQKAVDDVGFIAAILDDLSANFIVDERRIFITGFSNGASLSFLIGAKLSNRIAAIAPVAGANWLNTVILERPVPLLYITGNADTLNPIEGGVPKLATGASDKVRGKPKPPVRESITKWAQALECPLKPLSVSDANGVRTETYGPGRGGAEVVCLIVDDLGHVWPGGKSLLPEFMVGKQSDKIKATDVIWDFFKAHPSPMNRSNLQ